MRDDIFVSFPHIYFYICALLYTAHTFVSDRSAKSYTDDDARIRYNKRSHILHHTHTRERYIYDALRLTIPNQSLQDATNIYRIPSSEYICMMYHVINRVQCGTGTTNLNTQTRITSVGPAQVDPVKFPHDQDRHW